MVVVRLVVRVFGVVEMESGFGHGMLGVKS
jgi:hypothetical protein